MIVNPTRPGRTGTRACAIALLLAVSSPMLAAAQQNAPAPTNVRALSLDDAIRLAARESEALQISRAGISRAAGQVHIARSQYLPQLGGNLTYSRALRSQFAALAGGGGGADTNTAPQPKSLCTPPLPDNPTPAERAAALAQATTCATPASLDFSRVGFGARNSWNFGISASQTVFSGGRVRGQNMAAAATRRSAEVEFTSQRAQLALDVTQAYFDAVLADRLVALADTTLSQTEELLRQTTVARRVGNQSEFELLRATVTRDNQRPINIARRGDRDVAYLRLKQLLNIPLDAPLTLTTPIDEPAAVSRIIAANAATGPGAPFQNVSDTAAPLAMLDTTTAERAAVRQSAELVRAQEGQLRVARADRFPTLALTSGYQRLFFPQSFWLNLNQFAENWSVGGQLSVSLFSGGRVSGNIEIARANLDEARARLQQTQELAALDTRVALNQLQQAEAAFAASRGTAQQAARAYSIDEIRYREGISTQTDLNQSRILLQQATANQAQSARDLAVARARVALLRDLPLNTQALGGAAARANVQEQVQQQQQQQQQQPAQQQPQTSTAANPAGASQSGSFSQ